MSAGGSASRPQKTTMANTRRLNRVRSDPATGTGWGDLRVGERMPTRFVRCPRYGTDFPTPIATTDDSTRSVRLSDRRHRCPQGGSMSSFFAKDLPTPPTGWASLPPSERSPATAGAARITGGRSVGLRLRSWLVIGRPSRAGPRGSRAGTRTATRRFGRRPASRRRGSISFAGPCGRPLHGLRHQSLFPGRPVSGRGPRRPRLRLSPDAAPSKTLSRAGRAVPRAPARRTAP